MLMFEVNNRGNKLALGAFNEECHGADVDRNGLTSPGDGWLMRQGYTLVWFGWEMDVLPRLGHIGLTPIVARNVDGSPITGVVRAEHVTAAPTPTLPLSASQQVQAIRPTPTTPIPPRASTTPRRAPRLRAVADGEGARAGSARADRQL